MMPIFSKHKRVEAEEVKAGCGSLTMEQAEEIAGTIYGDGEEITGHKKLFLRGFLAGIAFVAAPRSAKTYGSTPREFLDNSYGLVIRDCIASELSETLVNAARGVLETHGIDADVRVGIADNAQGCGDE